MSRKQLSNGLHSPHNAMIKTNANINDVIASPFECAANQETNARLQSTYLAQVKGSD